MASLFSKIRDQIAKGIADSRAEEDRKKKQQQADQTNKRVFNASDFKSTAQQNISEFQRKSAQTPDNKKNVLQKAGDIYAGLAKKVVDNAVFNDNGSVNGMATAGKLMQRVPDTTINTTPDKASLYSGRPSMTQPNSGTGYDRYTITNGPLKGVKTSEFGGKITPVLSSMPGDIIKSTGQTFERLATQQGRHEIIAGVKNLPSEAVSVAKDPSQIGNVFKNPAIQTISDISNFIPVGGFTKEVAKESLIKGAAKAGEKAVAEDAAKAAEKKVLENQAAGKAVDEASSLRPLKSASTTDTGLPVDSSVADIAPSDTVTTTRAPSTKYTPGTDAKSILEDPGFISKYNSTIAEKPYLDNLMKDVSGGRPIDTGTKDINTAADKVVRKLNETPTYSENSLGDLVRGRVLAKDNTDANQVLADLQQKGNVTSVENYVDSPNPWGYQGINVNIKTPKGNLAEVQIHTPETLAIQKGLRPLYTQWRNSSKIPVEVFDQAKQIVDNIRAGKKPDALPLVKKGSDFSVNTQAGIKFDLKNKPEVTTDFNANLNDLPLVAKGEKPLSPTYPPGVKERKFVTTVRGSDTTAPEVAAGVKGGYSPITNKETLAAAQARIDANPDEALTFAKMKNVPADQEAEKVATQQLLMMKYQNEGNFNQAIDMAQTAAEHATSKGQAIQALSMWGRLTPEGALKYAQSVINKVNKDLPEVKQLKLSEDAAKKITTIAEDVQKLPEGSRAKTVRTAELLDTIAKQVPATLGEKLSSLQTMAQLLNPKTFIRNLGGNAGFMGIENAKDVVAATMDLPLSVVTGKRSKAFPSLRAQAGGAKEGFSLGLEDALKGVDTSANATKFDLPKTAAFRGKVGKGLQVLMDVELRATDRAFYTAAYNDSLRGQMALAKVSEPTEKMIEQAHFDGLYRTFQDDNVVSKTFSRIKKALNTIGTKDGSFGLGDLILKYPKTPGAILARAIDYSPAGFVKTVFDLAKPLVTKEPFNQRQFVEDTSRALVGSTGLVGAGAILHRAGIITGRQKGLDSDISQQQREVGLGNYKLNISALKRFVFSGMDINAAKPEQGDSIISYDWFQPQAIPLALGADIDANKGANTGIVGTIADSLASGSETLAEQPLVSGVQTLFNYGDLPGGVAKTLAGMPASFVPTFLNQIRQLVSNKNVNTYSPDLVDQTKNSVLGKLPLVANKLPPKVSSQGQDLPLYQNGSNNIFNVFFNPAFTSKLQEDQVGKEVLDLFQRTGDTEQALRMVPKTVDVGNKSIKLTAQQMADMQRYVGQESAKEFKAKINSPEYKQMTDDEKTSTLANITKNVYTAAKYAILGEKTKKKPGKGVRKVLNNTGFENLPLTTGGGGFMGN